MIKEAINFIEKYNKQKLGSSYISDSNIDNMIDKITTKYPHIIVVNTEMVQGKPRYAGFTLLSFNNEQMFSNTSVENPIKWLRNHRDILQNFEFNDFIYAMTDANKRIGSRSGLGTFSLFHFKLGAIFDSNVVYNPNKKIKAHKFKDIKFLKEINKLTEEEKEVLSLLHEKPDEVEEIIPEFTNKKMQRIGLILLSFLQELLQKLNLNKDDFKENENDHESEIGEKFRKISNNLYVYLDFDNPDLPRKVIDTRLETILFITSDTVEENSFCPICNTDGVKVGFPSSYNSLGTEKKPFNIHLDKTNPYNIKLCIKCLKKLNDFEQFLKEYNIKFFPLFIDENLKDELFRFLKPNQSFFEIIDYIYQIHRDRGDTLFDFYLLHISKDILYYDYINNYKKNYRNNYQLFFDEEGSSISYGPKNLKEQLREKDFVGMSSGYYFGSLRKMETYRKYLILKYRTKFFNSIYRNKTSLTNQDIKEIVSTILDHKIRNRDKISRKDICSRFLNFYLNSPLFCYNDDNFIKKNKDGDIMLETIRKEKREILKGNLIKIDSDEMFG